MGFTFGRMQAESEKARHHRLDGAYAERCQWLSVDLYGDLAGILQVSVGKLLPGGKREVAHEVHSEAADLQVTLVAGTGFDPTTFRL